MYNILHTTLALTAALLLAACSGDSNRPRLDMHASSSSTASSSHPASSAASSFHSASSATSSASSLAAVEDCRFDIGAGALPDNLAGFSVDEGTLLDGNGNPFMMRGINYPYAWFRHLDNEQHFADIAATCANSIRVVLSNGAHPGWHRTSAAELAMILSWASQNYLVAILEVHDSTGWPQNSNAADPQLAVDYWLADDIREVLDGTEAHVLINIANEPLGNFDTAEEDRSHWLAFHIDAIEQLRSAGVSHTLIVDAPNWGQDWRNIMRDGDAAQQVFDADPAHNVVFSVHMYDVYGTTAEKSGRVHAYLEAFAQKKLPLIVGEFAADHGPGIDNDVDHQAILNYADTYGVGYLAWSWSGNGGNLASLDIVQNFNPNQLSEWGYYLLHSAHGIRSTSERCSCFE